ncbi:MAG: type II and III secretion system protein [Verrucomicrobiaceae bacterium]|nr:type II and III secretion system protein [Verrucomicrobiaceae bacterium]
MRLPLSATILLVLGCHFFGIPRSVYAQSFMDNQNRRMSAEYEAEAARLRNAEPQQYDFSKAMLSDVLRFLATDAGISFFSLPDDSPVAGRLITFSIKASPFQVLETLCKANELSLIPDNGIWYIRPADDKELIGRSYTIRHNALELVEKVNLGTGSTMASGGGNGAPPSGLDLQGAKETFKTNPSAIIRDIRSILDLPPDDKEDSGSSGGGGGGGSPFAAAASGGGGDANAAAAASNSNELSANHKPKIIWKSDSNTLYVVATRLQHMWVEGYLEAADKEQNMIAIEVKFIETSNDPKREMGIDWSGTLGETGTFRKVTSYATTPATVDPTTGLVTTPATTQIETASETNTSGGFRTDLSNLNQFENLTNSAKNFVAPELGILTPQDVSIKLRALLRDEDTKTVSYPRMVTMNNREVAMRSVVNQPVLSASSSSSSGGGATTASQVAYLPIGTVLSILPKKMAEDKVLLNIAVTLSSIIGNETLQGNPYPVASSRVYSAPVEVNSGYTVAIGGLDEARERAGETGVPFLSRIPVLGWAFKYKSKERNHKNLMLFITPYLINAKDGGLPDQPQSIIPQKPGSKLARPKIDGATGALLGGVGAVGQSVEFMRAESDKLYKAVDEGIALPEDGKRLSELKTAVTHLSGQVDAFKHTNPDRIVELDKADADLKRINSRITEAQRKMFAKKFF